jgi:hypothetical protein
MAATATFIMDNRPVLSMNFSRVSPQTPQLRNPNHTSRPLYSILPRDCTDYNGGMIVQSRPVSTNPNSIARRLSFSKAAKPSRPKSSVQRLT